MVVGLEMKNRVDVDSGEEDSETSYLKEVKNKEVRKTMSIMSMATALNLGEMSTKRACGLC